MAELTPIPSARQLPTDQAYKPVSGYAVAATGVAGAFVLSLLGLVVSALWTKRSLLEYWLLIFPVVGIVLSILARSHIKKSEGTRIGLKLTAISWWTCVLGGAGYGAYLYANEVVLARESAAIADKFFTELQAGRVEHSFLYLVPPEERDRSPPEAGEGFAVAYAKSGFFEYRRHDIVRLLRRYGSTAQIEHVGVKDVKQEGGAFQATHIYRMDCAEGKFKVEVRMTATEPRRGGKPVWHIPNRPAPNISVTLIELSEFGRLIMEIEQEADAFAKLWMIHLTQSHPIMAQGLTFKEVERGSADEQFLGPAILGGGMVFSAPLTPDDLPKSRREARRLALYGPALLAGGPAVTPARLAAVSFDDLADIDFFKRDDANSPFPIEKWVKLRELWVKPNLAGVAGPRQMFDVVVQPDPPAMIVKDGELVVIVPAELFEAIDRFDRCQIGVISDNPELAAAMESAKQRGIGKRAIDSDGISSLPPRKWRIGWLRTDMEALPILQQRPGM